MRKYVLLAIVSLVQPLAGLSQSNTFCAARAASLYCKIPSVFGDAAVNPLGPLDQSLATQLTLVPLASPASGITYSKDPATKLPVPSGTDTLGPVLTERGETLYHGKLFLAGTYQRFRFDNLDGLDFKKIPMLFDFCTTAGQCGPIGAVVRLDAHLDQFAYFGTYGAANWLDLSMAIPFMRVAIAAEGLTCIPPYCNFTTAGGTTVSFQKAAVSGSATGIGDIVVRAKASVIRRAKIKLAVGNDLRLPSGDALNFLGAGSVGAKPFVAFSRAGSFSPHLNVSYQWNGTSLLAGLSEGQRGKLPENLSYIGGADVGISRTFTVSFDYLGEHVVNAARLATVTTLGISNAVPASGSFENARSAFGIKWKPISQLLITGNVLAKFDHNGLHHAPVPLVGISYTFRTPYER